MICFEVCVHVERVKWRGKRFQELFKSFHSSEQDVEASNFRSFQVQV